MQLVYRNVACRCRSIRLIASDIIHSMFVHASRPSPSIGIGLHRARNFIFYLACATVV